MSRILFEFGCHLFHSKCYLRSDSDDFGQYRVLCCFIYSTKMKIPFKYYIQTASPWEQKSREQKSRGTKVLQSYVFFLRFFQLKLGFISPSCILEIWSFSTAAVFDILAHIGQIFQTLFPCTVWWGSFFVDFNVSYSFFWPLLVRTLQI